MGTESSPAVEIRPWPKFVRYVLLARAGQHRPALLGVSLFRAWPCPDPPLLDLQMKYRETEEKHQ